MLKLQVLGPTPRDSEFVGLGWGPETAAYANIPGTTLSGTLALENFSLFGAGLIEVSGKASLEQTSELDIQQVKLRLRHYVSEDYVSRWRWLQDRPIETSRQ